ncbi:MAG: Crp/Fnr family transcriptional regulator [Chitinophagaceae bacterium]|nr:Crp/Fnr family transcriptional regulator [Chitinophagaceae bacterium]
MSIRDIFPIDKWDFKSQSIMAGLPEEDMAWLTAHQSVHIYSKGEIIFREGAYPTGIFFIITGMAKKFKTDKEGKEQIIYVANAGELIGYHAILEEDRFPDSAAALEESKVGFIPKEDFLETLRKSPLLNRRLLKTLSHEFAVLVNSITLFAHRPVRERLAIQLIVLREKYKVDFQPGMPVEINMSRDDLASLVGAARENVLRALAELREEGIIITKGRKIIVTDVPKLLSVANY